MALASKMMGGGMSSVMAQAINGDVNSAVSAAGTTQATATAINAGNVVVTTAAASSGVILPSGVIGDDLGILNLGANAVTVYPPVGEQINALSANTGFLLAPNTAVVVKKFTNTRWMAFLSA
tara:strand:- start:3649 stop:4014 length:366 start_codon:yes stop_codon:yes gene_type:complete